MQRHRQTGLFSKGRKPVAPFVFKYSLFVHQMVDGTLLEGCFHRENHEGKAVKGLFLNGETCVFAGIKLQ